MKFNVAVVGTGFIGKQHIEALNRVPEAQIVAVVGVDDLVVKNLQEKYFIPHSFKSIEELINSNVQIDVIHNCTPNALHYDINKISIESGINVYCEKPLTKNSVESDHLLRLIKQHKVIGGVNYNYRQNILVEEMRERVKKNGTPWFVSGEYLQDWLLFENDFDWRIDKEIGGESRAVADIGTHCFDTLEYILDSKIISVDARLYKKFEKRLKEDKYVEVGNEDAGVIFLEFSNGTIGIVRVSQVTAGKKNGLKVSIELDHQTLEWEQERPDRLWVGNRNEPNQELYASKQYLLGSAVEKAVLPNGHPVGWTDAFTSGIQNYYKVLSGDKDNNFADFEDGHHLMKVIEAVIESSKNSKKIYIN